MVGVDYVEVFIRMKVDWKNGCFRGYNWMKPGKSYTQILNTKLLNNMQDIFA